MRHTEHLGGVNNDIDIIIKIIFMYSSLKFL